MPSQRAAPLPPRSVGPLIFNSSAGPPSRKGGDEKGDDLLTFVQQDIPFRQVESFCKDTDREGLEALTFKLKTAGCSCVTVTNIYHPPVREGDQGDLGVCALWIPQSNFVIGAHALDLRDDRQMPDRSGRYS